MITTKIAVMDGVREHTEGEQVELGRSETTGGLVVRAYNEGRCNVTEVDLFDLLNWPRVGPQAVRKTVGQITFD